MLKQKTRNTCIALLLIVLLCAGMLSACGNDAAPADDAVTASANADGSDRIVLRLAVQEDATGGTRSAVDAFNTSQDKYEVVWEKLSNDASEQSTQLLTSLQSSGEYDVLSLNVCWVGEMIAAGYLEPLDMMMAEGGMCKADYNAGAMAAACSDGKQYGIPFFSDLALLFFRSDIVSPEDAEKLISGSCTWDELLAMAETYKGQGGTKDGIVFLSKQDEGLTCLATEFTSTFTDNAAGLATLKALTDSDATPTDILNYKDNDVEESFIGGNSVFARNWTYQYASLSGDNSDISPDQVAVAPLPSGDCVGGYVFGINRKSEHKEAAFELLQFLTGPDAQRIFAVEMGYPPGNNAMLKDEAVLASNALLSLPGYRAAVEASVSRPVVAGYNKMSNALQIEVHKYLTGAQALDLTCKNIQALLDEFTGEA